MNTIVEQAIRGVRSNWHLESRKQQLMFQGKAKDLFIMSLCAINFDTKLTTLTDELIYEFAYEMFEDLKPKFNGFSKTFEGNYQRWSNARYKYLTNN